MPDIPLFDMFGQKKEDIKVSDDIFAAPINEALIHQALVRQMANMRRGTHCTKTRSEVRGGGRKPWRQKGTGRSRHGSIRSPLWRGGGIIFGPKPRDYSQDMPRKMKRSALCGALSSKVMDEKIIAVEDLRFDESKTSKFIELLDNLCIEETALFIIDRQDKNLKKSASNIPGVKVITPEVINIKDILKYDKLVMTRESIACIEEVLA